MEMLQYDFIQRSFIAGIAMALITPILGLLLILRRQSLLSDTLSHISLTGVALGILLQWNPTITTLIVVIIASLMIEYLRVSFENFSELSVAIMMSGGMALALILISFSSNQANFRLDQYLFGSIILISSEEVKLLWVLAILILILYSVFKRPLYVLSFDEATALTVGLPVRLMSIVFSVITGVAISIMMPIVGALLISALIVIPSATAIKLSRSFSQAILIGIIINLIGIFTGITSSYYFDTPPGAAITMSFIIIFIIVSIIKPINIWLKKKKST
ncbi:metal ABC transporter permease [Aerococcaceae bacterium DSM 111020]|nr:metal ABC transporter permease [Aerococcaceae bacterium DSM 111020]